MRAYKSFAKFDVTQPFWKWIATIANNHCIDVLRRQNRTGELFGTEEAEYETLAGSDAPILSDLIASEDMEALNNAITTLPDKYRIPLVLAYFNQASYDEIAEQLAVSRNHVGVLLLRGKQRLRTALASSTQGTAQGARQGSDE